MLVVREKQQLRNRQIVEGFETYSCYSICHVFSVNILYGKINRKRLLCQIFMNTLFIFGLVELTNVHIARTLYSIRNDSSSKLIIRFSFITFELIQGDICNIWINQIFKPHCNLQTAKPQFAQFQIKKWYPMQFRWRLVYFRCTSSLNEYLHSLWAFILAAIQRLNRWTTTLSEQTKNQPRGV